MSLGRDDVAQIAQLARLAVSEDELASVAGDLSNILDLVEQLSRVDTMGVTPMAHPPHHHPAAMTRHATATPTPPTRCVIPRMINSDRQTP